MAFLSFLCPGCCIAQWLLKGHWKRHFQQVTICDFQAFIALPQCREHGAVLRTHSDRNRAGRDEVEILNMWRQLSLLRPQAQAHLFPFLFSGQNVLLFFRLGHTLESFHLELVLSTALHSLLSIQNLLLSWTFPASLLLLFKFYCRSYEFWFFDFVQVPSLVQYFWLYPRPTTQFLYYSSLWFLVNAWLLNWLDTNSFNRSLGDTYHV